MQSVAYPQIMGKRGYNAGMKKISWKIILVSIILILGGSGCGRATPPAPTPTLTPVGELILYVSPSPTATPTPAPIPDVTQQPKLPTPTPFTYVIQEGDTLSGIALRYNSSVDKIVAANPDINSNFLVIGEEIIIPPGDEDATTDLPNITPMPLSLQQPLCWSANPDGLWCFVEAAPLDVPLENVSAVVNVTTMAGEIAASEIALPPLSILRPEEDQPLVAYFSPPIPEPYQARVTTRTALPASGLKTQALVEDQEIVYGPDRQQATLTGTLSLPEESDPVQEIWMVGVAYDAENTIVGYRKRVMKVDLSPGQSMSFTLTVFSLGPPIDHLRVLHEAHE
ncbi:MAG: hypothetical protein MAG431_01371 [Chloroflexi bacterium]|nr:hypothetical protein [Chloroflexota bacterium]